MMPAMHTREDIFWARVAVRGAGECWPWIGVLSAQGSQRGGYGVMPMGIRGVRVAAHRFAYELLIGPIPPGVEIDHTCHNDSECAGRGADCPHRRCVNPAHLEPVTHAVNIQRGNHRQKGTHCSKGHPFTVAASGRNRCLICQQAKRVARRANN
jgi:hypothetical protein